MYKIEKNQRTTIEVNNSVEGETIEQKIERVVNNNEPITDGAPIIYTERKDGVRPEYDIRTDRFEIAIDGMDAVTKSHLAKRQAGIDDRESAKIVKLKSESDTKDAPGGESQGT